MSEAQFAAQLAKIDELVARNQALQKASDDAAILLHWTRVSEQSANQCLMREVLKNEELEKSLGKARELLLAWDQTNEHRLAELTRLYCMEVELVPALQGRIDALELEVKSLRDWNAATAAPVRCECKTCDRLAWEATQLHQ